MTGIPQQTDGPTTFLARAEIRIDATPEQVYDTVSDLGRSGEWSPECTGGTWVHGEPRTVGAIFRGDNLRSREVVAWAPVIRGEWHTESEVLEAVPGRVFRWCVLNSARGRQESVWSFEIEPEADGGCRLIHHYRLGRLTEGLAKIFESGLDEEGRKRFVADWNAKLVEDVRQTVERIKVVVEKS
ncbi:SRPBCC family protein [Streptomyces aidingensis]|uniref:Polyketide cyclase / dehydrase and lipid transport n=1 Tax=Streptomyces aidingensis TaxID=910347 RepID=A0A1I1FJN7_9ACTN|nr:SRPBCC family protein [Streptomyces aidingensis]SFB97888.1 Polyketide cyclase / dehydrase and lipid transport [Streptomyces aidingensis]